MYHGSLKVEHKDHTYKGVESTDERHALFRNKKRSFRMVDMPGWYLYIHTGKYISYSTYLLDR
jgi:hypothetical protein